MPQYDGSIRINTQIDSKNASAQLMALENRIVKTADKIASLRSKIDSLKDTKIPTEQYKTLSKELEKLVKKQNLYNEQLKEFEGVSNKENLPLYRELRAKLEESYDSADKLTAKMQELVDTGKAFTLGQDTEKYAKLGQQLKYAEADLTVLNQRHSELIAKQNKASDGYKRLGNMAKKSFNSINSMLKKANSLINSFGERIKKAFSNLSKTADSANKSVFGLSISLKNILKYGFGIRSIYVLFNKLRSAITDGFSNLLDYSSTLKNSINNVKASALTLKNAFAAAFSPFVEIAIPYVQKLLDYMTQLINMAGQFFAALTGRKTYIKAIKQTTAALEEETKAMNKQLSPLDKLNNISSESASKTNAEAGGMMFEEVPIDSDILNIAEKIKDILSKLFEPLKEAWNREGKFIMDSWKYALEEVRKLIKDIGRDFLTVWQQPETVDMFADILHIVGDIGLIVGHLARNFREAWNENETGLHILENIRDILAVIIHNIRLAADYTVQWADKLDFSPLLEAFVHFTKSLIPVMDALSGVLTDFYEQVLLPLGKWTLEKGLPELLDVFTAFNEKVDWKALRDNLSELWQHLEPFAETIGEGLIIFIESASDAVANFINSETLINFLYALEDWMDSVTPEDVADAIGKLAKSLVGLKLALLGFGAISALVGVFTTIKSFFSVIWNFGGLIVDAAKLIAAGIGKIVAALGGIETILAAVAAVVAAWHIGSWIAEKLELDPKSFKETMREIKDSFTDGSWKEALKLWGEDIKESVRLIGEFIKNDWSNSYIGQMISSFTDGSWREALALWGEDIKANIKSVGEFIKNDWNNSYMGQMISSFTDGSWKKALSLWGNEIKLSWNSTWDSMQAKISSVISNIKSIIKSAFDWISQKIGSIADKFGSFGSKVGGMFSSGSSGITFSSRSVYSLSPAMANLADIEFPAYATGQVIPTSMKQHLAWLGDNPRETEVVSPLSTIKQANKESLLETLSELGLTGGVGGGQEINLHLTVECEGYQLLDLMRKLDRDFFKRTGRHAFT